MLLGLSMIVATAGTFDLFHVGHANLLRRCRWLAGDDGEVIVILNLDDFVESYKGKRPVIGYQDRAAVLRALRDVDVVVPNVGGSDLKPSLIEAAPDILLVGSDWQARDYYAQINASPAWLRAHGITVRYEPYTPNISTSLIRERMNDRPV